MLKFIEHKQDCCGCTACQAVCPTAAIAMERDEEGFVYPRLIPDKCVGCGLCEQVCALRDLSRAGRAERAVEAWRKGGVFPESQSGGAFMAVATAFLEEKQGVVYGVELEGKTARWGRAETPEDCRRFAGSKYVQAEVGDAFARVEQDLKAGRAVLFSGTACTVNGLRNHLARRPAVSADGLYTCDLICHGVASPRLAEEYLDLLETESGKRVEGFRFRDSLDFPWDVARESWYWAGEDTKYYSANYFNLFSTNLTLRPSCHACRFAAMDRRPADLTLGDNWGSEQRGKRHQGLSTVLVNSAKGGEMAGWLSRSLQVRPMSLEDGQRAQPNLHAPTPMPPQREEFWAFYRENGLRPAMERFVPRMRTPLWERLDGREKRRQRVQMLRNRLALRTRLKKLKELLH